MESRCIMQSLCHRDATAIELDCTGSRTKPSLILTRASDFAPQQCAIQRKLVRVHPS
jgi:hypothetical protein